MNKSCDRRRSDRKGREKVIYDIHVSRIKAAKGLIDCTPPRPHPFTNKTDMDQVISTKSTFFHCAIEI
jgi:hypothetical protein